MRNARLASILVLVVAGGYGQVIAADGPENHFASIHLNRDKIGQVHYFIETNEDGEIEELKTRASVSVLGFKVFHFTQDLHEIWANGELQRLNGDTDDDGTSYEVTLTRDPAHYEGELNGETVTVPHDAFPASLWHYRITEQTLLFDLKDLRLLEVQVTESAETLSIDGQAIATSRFDFTGDWQGTVWFDQDRQFVKAAYQVDGRDVTVTLDP